MAGVISCRLAVAVSDPADGSFELASLVSMKGCDSDQLQLSLSDWRGCGRRGIEMAEHTFEKFGMVTSKDLKVSSCTNSACDPLLHHHTWQYIVADHLFLKNIVI